MKLNVLIAATGLVCGSLLCGPALAQTDASLVDGDWIGKGSFQLGPDIQACSEIKMKFIGTATLYGVRDESVVCEGFKQAFPMNNDFAVKGNGEVYYLDQKVGGIVGNRLTVLVPGKDQLGNEFILRREGDLLYYNEVASKPGQAPEFGMVAIMKKDPNPGGTRP
jgi:hypothetical protein